MFSSPFFLIGIQMLYNVVLVFVLWQRGLTELNWTDTYTPWPSSLHPTPLGHHRALSWAPCTKQHLPSSYLFYTFCCSLAQSCLALYNPMDCSMPSFPGLQYLSEFAETHVHWVGDAFQPFHPCHPFSSCPQFSQHQWIVQWVSSSHQVVKVLGVSASASVIPMNIQCWFPLGLTGLISLISKRLSRVFSNTTVPKHQFFGTWLSLWTNSHIRTWLLEKTIALTVQTFVSKMMSQLFNVLSRFISFLAWRIPGTGEPSGLLSMGLHRVGHNWSDLAAAATDSS